MGMLILKKVYIISDVVYDVMQALPGRMAKLRAGGAAALRELRRADEAEQLVATAAIANDAEDDSAHLLKKRGLARV